MTKAPIRTKILNRRNALKSAWVRKAGAKVALNLFSMPEYVSARRIYFYASFKNEVTTFGIIKRALSEGKKIALPKTIVKERKLEFYMGYPVKSKLLFLRNSHAQKDAILQKCNTSAGLKRSKYGILEPGVSGHPLCVRWPDIVLVPGVAFDRRGRRIGFGAGFYDRFLKRLPKKTLKIGLAYDFQVVKHIPAEKHDVKLDALVTESRILRFRV